MTIITSRTTVRVVLANGVSWVTTINTDFAGAIAYYFGAGSFECPDETVSRVVRVEQLAPDGSVVRVVTAEESSANSV